TCGTRSAFLAVRGEHFMALEAPRIVDEHHATATFISDEPRGARRLFGGSTTRLPPSSLTSRQAASGTSRGCDGTRARAPSAERSPAANRSRPKLGWAASER